MNQIIKKIRLKNTAKLLSDGLPVNEDLPLIQKKVKFRSEDEIAGRINILHILYTISSEGSESKDFFFTLIRENNWENFLSEKERIVLNKSKLSVQDIIDLSWSKEAMFALLWAVGIVENIDLLEEIDIADYYDKIPPELDYDKFRNSLKTKSWEEIIDKLDFYYNLHWALKKSSSMKRKTLSLVMERRKALEWVYEKSESWDNISLDT